MVFVPFRTQGRLASEPEARVVCAYCMGVPIWSGDTKTEVGAGLLSMVGTGRISGSASYVLGVVELAITPSQ